MQSMMRVSCCASAVWVVLAELVEQLPIGLMLGSYAIGQPSLDTDIVVVIDN